MFSNSYTEVKASDQMTLKRFPQPVIEHLRIAVPAKHKQAWLIAEKKAWEPWLAHKEGFLGRQLLWDPKREEATLLITWASRSDWKNIPQTEITEVQELFEEFARDEIGMHSGNPFPLKFEGELLIQ